MEQSEANKRAERVPDPMYVKDIYDSGDQTVITHEQHVGGILRDNQLARQEDFKKHVEMRQVAAIPVLVAASLKKYSPWVLNDPKELKKWLMLHPEYMTTTETL